MLQPVPSRDRPDGRGASLFLFRYEPVDQLAGDTDFSGKGRQVVNREPAGIFDLPIVEDDVAPGISGSETDHERMGKGPGLAAKVLDIPDRQADFLSDLAGHGLLQRFARLYKASQDTVYAWQKVAGSGQEEFVSPLDQDNNGRGEAGKMEEATLGTFFGAFGRACPQRDTTSAAKPVCPVPVYDLHCPGRYPEEVFIQATIHLP